MTSDVEVERKFALADGQQLPPLDDLATAGNVHEFDLTATYYDAPDFRLTAAKQVIRRRTGGHDEGWHLKTPGAGPDERVELHAHIDPRWPEQVPAPFWAQVAAHLDGAPLVPVAVLHTHRREQELLGVDHAVLAYTCTDDVRAEVDGRTGLWREAEVELAGGDAALLDAIEARLAAAGIPRAGIGSKIARALSVADVSAPLGPESTAGEVLVSYVAAQVGALQFWERSESGLGAGLTHDGRVAMRRLRSVLKTYRALLEPRRVKKLRAELRWLGGELSPLRDAEIVGSRMANGFESDDDYAHGVVFGYESRVGRALVGDLLDTLDAERLARLMSSLARFVARPPFTEAAGRPAIQELVGLWVATTREVRRRLAATAHWGALGAWHEVRKAAKAVRYGAEVLVPVLPELDTARANWEQVTEALGAVQDAVVTHREINELALGAAADGHPGVLPDSLWRREEQRLASDLDRARAALKVALDGG